MPQKSWVTHAVFRLFFLICGVSFFKWRAILLWIFEKRISIDMEIVLRVVFISENCVKVWFRVNIVKSCVILSCSRLWIMFQPSSDCSESVCPIKHQPVYYYLYFSNLGFSRNSLWKTTWECWGVSTRKQDTTRRHAEQQTIAQLLRGLRWQADY